MLRRLGSPPGPPPGSRPRGSPRGWPRAGAAGSSGGAHPPSAPPNFARSLQLFFLLFFPPSARRLWPGPRPSPCGMFLRPRKPRLFPSRGAAPDPRPAAPAPAGNAGFSLGHSRGASPQLFLGTRPQSPRVIAEIRGGWGTSGG